MGKKVSMRDIAQALGVSVNAVSLALNDRKGVSKETRLKVMEAAQNLGYLDHKVHYANIFGLYHLCILIQDIYHVEGGGEMTFYGQILYYAIREARDRGYDTVVHYFNDQHIVIPDCISAHKVTGIIVLGKISTANIEKLQATDIRMVIVDHNPRLPNTNCILTDNISGGFMATRRLIRGGFSKIGYFGAYTYSNSIKERYYGFVEALVQEGLVNFQNAGEYVQKYSIMGEIEPYVIDNNIDAIKKLLPRKAQLPQAYFCGNDAAALILIAALRRKNIEVPEEVSVIGFDNSYLAEKSSPKLTTINVSQELMGQKAVRRLVQLIENENEEAEHTILGVELVERESVQNSRGL
jgi:DNA-binding LacI/PurR family transcriptional regulator